MDGHLVFRQVGDITDSEETVLPDDAQIRRDLYASRLIESRSKMILHVGRIRSAPNTPKQNVIGNRATSARDDLAAVGKYAVGRTFVVILNFIVNDDVDVSGGKN